MGIYITRVEQGYVDSAGMIGEQRIGRCLKDGSRFATVVPMGKMPDLLT